MPLASGSRTQLSYIAEATFGTTPGAGNGINLRRTDDTLGFKTQTTVSQEIRSDRMTSDLVLVGASAEGGINFELSYNEYDNLLAGMLQNTWTVYGTNGVGPSMTGTWAATTLTGTGYTATNLVKGQWLKVKTTVDGGANDQAILQLSKTTAPTTTVFTFETPYAALTTGAAPASTMSTSRLINGTTQTSYTLERQHADITQYVAFRGMTPSKMSMNFQSGAIVTGTMEFIGKDQVIAGAKTLPGTLVASKTFDIMNAVSGVGTIMEGGAALTGTYIKSLTLDIDNGLRGRDAIGTLGNVDIAAGTLSVSGKIMVYFANATLYNKFINSTSTSLSFSALDPSKNGYIFDIPKVKFSEGNIVSGNRDSDSMVEMTFTGLMATATGTNYMISIDRVGAAVT